MTHSQGRLGRRDADVSSSDPHSLVSAEMSAMLEIADLLDNVAGARRLADITAEVDELDIRRELFKLLDEPTQECWESVREIELYPSYFPGLATPSPLGITLGDLAYNAGLGDVDCPSKSQIMEALQRGLVEHLDPIYTV
jgi:hypothetical protein